MANWSLLQETLIDKPVWKRARHGIHFKQADGSILANFSGKPCHYQDTDGLWKPIDTKPVLRKDGWYGCPHSDVVIHPDGTVKVGEYAQKATLILAKEGKVDGDCIIREFDGGRQIMRITEDGFRQEIILDKIPDLKQASALLDTVSGVLPSKYTASALTAKDDSTTAELADSVSLDSKTIVEYLESAKYPVVIDPDFSTSTSVGDTKTLAFEQANYNYGSLTSLSVYRGSSYFKWDCSSIDGGSTATAVSIGITIAKESGTGTMNCAFYSIASANSDWYAGTSNGAAEEGAVCHAYKAYSATTPTSWAGSADCGTSGTDYESNQLGTLDIDLTDVDGTVYTSVFNANGISRIQNWFGSINTNYGLVFKKYDGANPGSNWRFDSSEIATEADRPVLAVTYSAAAASLHTLSLLGVGK